MAGSRIVTCLPNHSCNAPIGCSLAVPARVDVIALYPTYRVAPHPDCTCLEEAPHWCVRIIAHATYSRAEIVSRGVLPSDAIRPYRSASSVISAAVSGRPVARKTVTAADRYLIPAVIRPPSMHELDERHSRLIITRSPVRATVSKISPPGRSATLRADNN